jgi:hypothetical protein
LFIAQEILKRLAEWVIPKLPNQIDILSQSGSSNCLIASFSPRNLVDLFSKYGFAWMWKLLHFGDDIHINTAGNNNISHLVFPQLYDD